MREKCHKWQSYIYTIWAGPISIGTVLTKDHTLRMKMGFKLTHGSWFSQGPQLCIMIATTLVGTAIIRLILIHTILKSKPKGLKNTLINCVHKSCSYSRRVPVFDNPGGTGIRQPWCTTASVKNCNTWWPCSEYIQRKQQNSNKTCHTHSASFHHIRNSIRSIQYRSSTDYHVSQRKRSASISVFHCHVNDIPMSHCKSETL